MAKKSVQRSQITAMLASIEAQMAQIYGNTYAEVMRLSRIRKAIEEGEEFEFDGNKAAAMQVEGVLRTLAAQTTMLIKQGDKEAWEAGEKNADNTLGAIFGKTKDGKATLEELTQRAREEARGRGADANGFYHRQEGGMNISERVWKVTEQSKRDIELLIQNGVKQGKTADEISRDIRPFLQNPTAQFRRVRNKKTGELELSKAAKAYHAGVGVYRSAYKNAMRLARTEVNMAYRRAEWESYQSNPLVTGIRIGLSNNHTTKNSKGQTVPLTDICDELAGDYPKTFQWTGWHPQCRCRMTPITVSQDDFKERMKALFSGALDDWKPETTVTAPPKEFDTWVKANLGRLQNAKSMPYFIRDNFVGGNPAGKLEPAIASLETEVQKQKKSKEEIAELKKQLDGIKKETSFFGIDTSVADELVAAGDAAQLKRESASVASKVANGKKAWEAFVNATRAEINDLFGKQAPEIKNEAADILSDLIDEVKSAKESGKFGATMEEAMENIRIEINHKKEELEEMKKKKMKEIAIMNEGKNILQTMSGISDVDTDTLKKALAAGDFVTAEKEAVKLKELWKHINGLKFIENPMDAARNYGAKDITAANEAIKRTFDRWTWDVKTEASLNFLKRKLENEITVVSKSGKIYSTWQLARDAYEKRLEFVNKRIEMLDIRKSIESELKQLKASRKPAAKQVVAEFEALFNDERNDNVTTLKAKSIEIVVLVNNTQKNKNKEKTEAELKQDVKDFLKKYGLNINTDELQIDKLSGCLQFGKWEHAEKLYKTTDITQEEEIQTISHEEEGGYIRTSNSFTINGAIRDVEHKGQYQITGEITNNDNIQKAGDKYGYKLKDDDIKTILTLDNVIKRNKLPFPILLYRSLDDDAISSLFGFKIDSKKGSESYADQINQHNRSMLIPDPAFNSVSLDPTLNVFTYRDFLMEIEVPAGTPIYITKNYMESECILGRSTKYEFRYAKYSESDMRTIIRVRLKNS